MWIALCVCIVVIAVLGILAVVAVTGNRQWKKLHSAQVRRATCFWKQREAMQVERDALKARLDAVRAAGKLNDEMSEFEESDDDEALAAMGLRLPTESDPLTFGEQDELHERLSLLRPGHVFHSSGLENIRRMDATMRHYRQWLNVPGYDESLPKRITIRGIDYLKDSEGGAAEAAGGKQNGTRRG